ncbi:MAG: hypothetical protein JSW18_05765 [Candidatus Omnitrophota bacterium]|nr:MAG: hypothetical protein JSW18_05765 [Candidatus Omnitrophota bacterium]
MNLTKEERIILKNLVERELKEFENEERVIRDVMPNFIVSEEKYESMLKELLGRLK